MPRALEMLDHTIQRLEKGELGAIEAIDGLLAQEFTCREDRRVGMALTTSRLTPPKTIESFDFTFQPSLDRDRIMALAQLDFITRAEVVHFLGPPGTPPKGSASLSASPGILSALNRNGCPRQIGILVRATPVRASGLIAALRARSAVAIGLGIRIVGKTLIASGEGNIR